MNQERMLPFVSVGNDVFTMMGSISCTYYWGEPEQAWFMGKCDLIDQPTNGVACPSYVNSPTMIIHLSSIYNSMLIDSKST